MALLLSYLICVCILLPFPTLAQTNKNITLGSSLEAGAPTSSWASPSKHFAFGFQEIEPGSFLLAIWFNRIPEKTITWYANGGHPVSRGSRVILNGDAGLVLTDHRGNKIWNAMQQTARSGEENIAYAAMLDTGNFVLATQASAVLWQSFDEPTDTLLPTQSLNQGSQLLARFSERNYTGGRFSFKLQDSGELALYTTNFPLFSTLNEYYWDYGTAGSGYQVVFNQSGLSYIVARNGSILAPLFDNEVSKKQVLYHRVILEYDGVLRHYVYLNQSSNLSGGWSNNYFTPENICSAVIQQTGSGVCGYNSYCKLGNEGKPRCICPPGYTLLDPGYEMSGCFQSFPPQSCENPSKTKNQFDFEVLQDVDWPLADYEHFQNVSIEWCREVCLVDCVCAVGIFRENGDCWKKRLPLSNGKNDSTVERTALIKYRTAEGRTESRTAKRRTTVITIVIVMVSVITFIIFIIGARIVIKRRKQHLDHKDDIAGMGSIDSCFEFSFKTIRVATNGFLESNKLGQGGFGTVYKGRLSNGQPVAVKRLTRATPNGDEEFKNEIQLVARLHHRNLIRLIGFCLAIKERILIYELAPNGSLDHILFDANRRKDLTWNIRYSIIKGIAHGLLYLHEESQLKIIHRDLKAGNVLLDEYMVPKISDFGTARLFVEEQGSASRVVGTYGYMPPEYANFGKISTKVDVFGFGVLLLEIVSGRKNNISPNNSEQIDHLLSKVWKCWTLEQLTEVIDPVLLREGIQSDDITQCIHIGLLCVQEKVAYRPRMIEVFRVLEGFSQILPPPSKPAYLMEIESSRLSLSAMGNNVESKATDSDADHDPTERQLLLPSAGSSSITENSFTHTHPAPR